MEACYFLILYWLVFWKDILAKPWQLSTSELASTFFPHWLWMGRKWRWRDSIFYKFPACIPFLSMWYPGHVVSAILGRCIPGLDGKFRVFAVSILLHYLLGSFISFAMFRQTFGMVESLFGAVTLTYCAYAIKPQTPAAVYTFCWMPGMLINGWFGALSCGMAILGGYWPVLAYFLPLAFWVNPSSSFGIVLAVPQIACFLWYWPKSVRSGRKWGQEGRVPLWKLVCFALPFRGLSPTSGVHFPEMSMYMGLACFLIFHASAWWIPLGTALLIALGILPAIQRIPARALYLASVAIAYLAVQGLSAVPSLATSLLVLQCFLLLKNSSIYPSFPFSQWYDRPSVLYAKYKDKAKWPHFSGYLDEEHHADYQGDFRLKSA